MIPTLTFASCYVYSPTGASAVCRRSRLLRALLKAGDSRFLMKYALRVRQQGAERAPLAGYFSPSAVLIPIPGSLPQAPEFTNVASHLARALLDAGLGQGIWPGLHRVQAVPKSATAAPGARPTVAHHYESFAVETALPPREVLLVDDIVTKGRTLLAAAARVQEAFPRAHIRAFALLRTMGFAAGVNRLLEPCVGEIKWRADDARRSP
jgi:hypothetical protein